MAPPSDDGITRGSTVDVSEAILISSFVSVALYNVVELTFLIFSIFKKRSGLYFWSFLIATWGIAPYAVGFLFKYLQLINGTILYICLISVGWCAMVIGQSFVLYSRLHLLILNDRLLHAVRNTIIVNSAVCYVPSIALLIGANSHSPSRFLVPYSIWEKIQVTLFFLQEVTISGLYIWEALKLLQLGGSAIHYASRYGIQTTYKALVYGVKLKLEFSILNRLVELTQSRRDDLFHHSLENSVSNQLDMFNPNNSVAASGSGSGGNRLMTAAGGGGYKEEKADGMTGFGRQGVGGESGMVDLEAGLIPPKTRRPSSFDDDISMLRCTSTHTGTAEHWEGVNSDERE
ncbi:hypothetical protein QBC46DRAFT_356998 [Diplogelasinospora grovesii]|uniref:DUF7703 domain-containing protein n=1 Tax=Diplogelasinospora grovesii TaxID=303347 RepID=A0AAN6S250_9PEZI|nr:hypothetical protein QBC46DRAFT_356998 [Diplogelasinospora grovesii]